MYFIIRNINRVIFCASCVNAARNNRLFKSILANMSANSAFLSSLCKRLTQAELKLESTLSEIKEIKREISSAIRQEGERNLNDDLQKAAEDEIEQCMKRFKSDDTDSNFGFGNFNKENDYVVVYTDGACENNGKSNAKAGIGVWWGRDHHLNVSMPVKGRATNNTAEIQACRKAMELALQNNIEKLVIKTDSQFVINSMTKWIKNWKKNNWRLASGGDVKNKEDFVKLDEAQNKLAHVKWEYVPGHAGHFGNEEADKLARDGALRYV